jgi:hypothetical protein
LDKDDLENKASVESINELAKTAIPMMKKCLH